MHCVLHAVLAYPAMAFDGRAIEQPQALRSTCFIHFPDQTSAAAAPRNPSNAVNGQWVGGSGVLFACVGRPRTRILGLQPAARAMRQSRLPLIGGLFSWLALRRDAASEGVRKI